MKHIPKRASKTSYNSPASTLTNLLLSTPIYPFCTFDLSLIDFADGMSSERQEGKTDNEGENTGIHELLGVAIGCIGMSFDDFCRSEVP